MPSPIEKIDSLITSLRSPGGDRRRSRRLKQTRRIRIVCHDGAETYSAILIDISAGGARLRVMSDADIPDAFGVELEQGLVVPCRATYRKDSTFGVEFILPTR